MAGGEEGGGRDFKMFCQTGVRIFSSSALCVWGGGGRGGLRFSTSSSVKK